MRVARYARLYDGIVNHQKFVGLDPTAGWLWTLSLAYCHDQLTDGWIPPGQPARLLAVGPKAAAKLAQKLIISGLWEQNHDERGGWLLHDYLEWNDSKEDILAEQARQAERKRRQRHGARPAGQDMGHPPRQDMGRPRTAQSSTELSPNPLTGFPPSTNGAPLAPGWRPPAAPGGLPRPPAAWLHDDGCPKSEHLAAFPEDRRGQCPAHRQEAPARW